MTRIGALLWLLLLTGGPAAANEKLSFVLDWKADAERGGYYQALATGLYKKHGLDVTIVQGGPGIDNQQLIAAGAVDLAQGGNSFLPFNLLQAGAPVKAIMGIYQRSPQILIAHAAAHINSLADMKDKPIMLAPSSFGTIWIWMKAKYGFTDRQIRPISFDLAPWIADPTAIAQGYATSDPYVLSSQNIAAKYFLLADDGFPSYGAVVMASDRLIVTKPAVVQAFVDASIEGWYSYLYGDPKPGLDLVKSLNDEATDARNAEVIRNIKQHHLVDGDDARKLGIGTMTDQKWHDFFALMVKLGVYPADLDYRQAFTLEFVSRTHVIPPSP